MVDDGMAPLLSRASTDEEDASRANGHHHHHRPRSESPSFFLSSESTPLLRHEDANGISYGTRSRTLSSASAASHPAYAEEESSKHRRSGRWPIIIAITLLIIAVILTLVFGFVAPAAIKQYAQEAAVFKPQKISLDSATADGISVRIEGEFLLDASRVNRPFARGTGQVVTWIAKEVETSEMKVDVYLPEYNNVLLGSAYLPSVMLNIRQGYSNQIDIVANLHSGDVAGVRQVADDWMSGRLSRLLVQGIANLDIRSGILKFENQNIAADVVLTGKPLFFLPALGRKTLWAVIK